MTSLLSQNTLLVNQKFTILNNQYQIFDTENNQIGFIKEQSSFLRNILMFFIPKMLLPFNLQLFDENENLIATISKGYTFHLAKFSIKNSQDEEIATISQKFNFLKPSFIISDVDNNQIATITGNWRARDFHIIDNTSEQEIGTVSKKWAGLAKEMFTHADKYAINISESLSNESYRVALISTVIAIDLIFRESRQ